MLPTIYFIIVFLYGIMAIGLYLKEYAPTLLGALALFALSVYIYANGIDIYRNFLTDMFAAVTFGIAAYVGLRGGYELYKNF